MLNYLLTAEQFTALPEELQAEYKQSDSGYVLDLQLPEGQEVANVTNLKKALSTERTNNVKLNEQIKKFGDLDPEEAKTAYEKRNEYLNFNKDQKVQEAINDAVKQVTKKNETLLAEVKERAARAETQLKSKLITNALQDALMKAKCSHPHLIMPSLERLCDMTVEETGVWSVRVNDENGIPQLSASGSPLTIEELVDDVSKQERYAVCFPSTTTRGTSTPPTSGKPAPTTPGKIRIVASDQVTEADLADLESGAAIIG